MLGSLTGTVAAVLENRLLIEVQGVGYWVFTGGWRPVENTDVTAYLHHAVREEASDLYGFPSIASLQLFEQLITVNGVGPKAAMAILSLDSADRIRQAIATGDTTFLALASGVGKKAAEKIVLDLKKKMGVLTLEGSNAHVQDELIETLENLGFKQQEIAPLLTKIPAELTTTEEQLAWALKERGKRN